MEARISGDLLSRGFVRLAGADLDYQFIANPAYNRDRGPVSLIGAQLHAGF